MGVSQYSMSDIANLVKATNIPKAEHSTSRANNTELNMEDFLKLMVTQLQSQTIDDTMDTSEMMNQMVQMQMVTALSNMTETNIMSYAASLVGQVVTIGIVEGNNLEEREILVMGTGVYNGQQVIFGTDGNTYNLNQIMAIGRLPEIESDEAAGEDEGAEGVNGAEGAEGSTNSGSNEASGTSGANGAEGSANSGQNSGEGSGT